MKIIHFILTCFIILLCTKAATSVNINQALKQKLIQSEIFWKHRAPEETTSLRHGNNLLVKLTNLSGKNIVVEIPAGFMFTAADSTKQNMLITENMQFDLLPLASESKFTQGYCCEATDGSPDEGDAYKIKKQATAQLQQLAEFISKNNFEGYAVQRAIWCVSNKYDLDDINSEDTSLTHKLIDFTGGLMNCSPHQIAQAHTKSQKQSNGFEKTITLEIPIKSNTTEVWIVIQNINNNSLQTVMKKQRVEKGILKMTFGVSSIDLGSGNFIIRAYSTDSPVVEKKFKLDV